MMLTDWFVPLWYWSRSTRHRRSLRRVVSRRKSADGGYANAGAYSIVRRTSTRESPVVDPIAMASSSPESKSGIRNTRLQLIQRAERHERRGLSISF